MWVSWCWFPHVICLMHLQMLLTDLTLNWDVVQDDAVDSQLTVNTRPTCSAADITGPVVKTKQNTKVQRNGRLLHLLEAAQCDILDFLVLSWTTVSTSCSFCRALRTTITSKIWNEVASLIAHLIARQDLLLWCWLGPLAGSSGQRRFPGYFMLEPLCIKWSKLCCSSAKVEAKDVGCQPTHQIFPFCLVVPSHLQILTPENFVNAVHTVHFHTYSSTPLGLLGLSVTWCSHYRLLDCPLELSWQGTVKYRREKPSFGPASLSIKGAEKRKELPSELKAEQNHPPF